MRKLLFTLFILGCSTQSPALSDLQIDESSLHWSHPKTENVSFLIYGNDDFLGETSTNSWPIENNHTTYSIIANDNGELSPPLRASSKKQASTPYVRNPYVSDEVWEKMKPFFLPESMPEKDILDKIFSKRRVLASTKEMGKAGFVIITDPKHKIIVAKHYKLKGYLFKVYLDPVETTDWIWWKKRIEGINVIQASINKHGYQSIMKTPKKWVYPVPAEPSPPAGAHRSNFILVVEQMDILNSDANRKAYKKKMTKEKLHALYTVIMENKLIDSIYCDNTPFCSDGKLAFIDTEHSLDTTQPVAVWIIGNYLSKELNKYWLNMIQTGVR